MRKETSPEKAKGGTRSNRTFFYGGNAGIVGDRARVQSEFFFDVEEFEYKAAESEFDGRIIRRSYTSEGIEPLILHNEESVRLEKRKKRKKNKDKEGCC